MTVTIKDKTRKRIFNTSLMREVKVVERGNMLVVTAISNETDCINGKVFPHNFRFSCSLDSDRERIVGFFMGQDKCNFLEVKSDKTLEFGNI